MNVASLTKKYLMQSVIIMLCVAGIELLLSWCLSNDFASLSLLISAIFCFVLELIDILAWSKMARQSTDAKLNFFVAVTGGRFFLVLLLIFVYYLLSSASEMATFLLNFAPFYLAILFHHSYFFTRLTK